MSSNVRSIRKNHYSAGAADVAAGVAAGAVVDAGAVGAAEAEAPLISIPIILPLTIMSTRLLS